MNICPLGVFDLKRFSTLSISVICVLATFITSAVAIESTTRPQREARKENDAITPLPSPHGAVRNKQFIDRANDGPIDLLFLGDSITDSWPRIGEFSWLKLASYNPANFGVGGERTEQMLWRLNKGELEGLRPKMVVILIGTNNIGQDPPDKPEWAAGGIEKVVLTVRTKLPTSKILLLGVFPRDGKGDRKRADIAIINTRIAKLADANIEYLDIGNVFLDRDSEISRDVLFDRLHPTAKGYEIMLHAIQPSIDRVMK